MPIELVMTTEAERSKERAYHLEQAERVTVGRITLPTGRANATGQMLHDTVEVVQTPAGFVMTGDLAMFGVDPFGPGDGIPLMEAVDEADAGRLAYEKVLARWAEAAREVLGRADSEAEAAALGG